jgi:putative DNA primase/helicase
MSTKNYTVTTDPSDGGVGFPIPLKMVAGGIEQVLIEANTHHSVALAFVERYKGKIKYDHGTRSWLMFNGTHWAKNTTGIVSHYCREMSSQVGKEGQREPFAKGVERFAMNDPAIAIDFSLFDHNNYLLNCPDGTYNLLTGERREHRDRDLISNITAVAPAAPGDYGTRFRQFLKEVTQDDTDKERFLQLALGSTLSGAIENHHLLFFIGQGRNGKNTLGDNVMEAMGSYARKIPNNVLMKGKSERHPVEVADLKGSRLAVASETDQGSYWDEPRINEFTGDKRIKARFMYGNPFEFDRTFKFLIYGNHRPRLQNITPAIISRIKIVRFGASFAGREDPDLPAKLKEESGNILRWLIDGHMAWVEAGKKLPKCKAVEDELRDYIDEQATVQNWIDEFLDPIDYKDFDAPWARSSELYSRYKNWKLDRGEQAVSQTLWGADMVSKFKKKKAASGWLYAARIKSAVLIAERDDRPMY